MRAHLIQMDLAWEDRRENLDRADRLLRDADPEPGDLVVLPELFDSGFSLNTDVTRDARGETLAWLAELSSDLGVTVQGGRTVRSCSSGGAGCGLATNRAPVLAPDDSAESGARLLCEYSKIHPFSFGREPEAFRGGDEVMVYPWTHGEESITVCPVICYDLRFPELFRRGLALGAEVFAIGANWPSPRQTHWRTLAIARAIENQAYVFAVNRCGTDPHLHYAGGTIAVGPRGEVIGEIEASESARPGVLTVEADPDAVRGWRNDFPAWRDMKMLGLEPPAAT